jgi:hypothetical protein
LNVELLYDLSLIKEVPKFKIENSKFKIPPAFLHTSLRVSSPFGLSEGPSPLSLRAQAEAASAAWREAIYLRMVNRGILASGASRRRTKEEKKAKAQSKRTEGAPGEMLDVKRTAGSGTGFLFRRTAERKSTFEAWPHLSVPVRCNELLGPVPLQITLTFPGAASDCPIYFSH